MASPGRDEVTDGAGSRFPAVDVDGELHPGHNKHVEVDPVSSQVAASLDAKEQAKRKAVEEEGKKKKDKEAMQTLKTTFIVSGIIAAVAVAAFVIVKKLREN